MRFFSTYREFFEEALAARIERGGPPGVVRDLAVAYDGGDVEARTAVFREWLGAATFACQRCWRPYDAPPCVPEDAYVLCHRCQPVLV